MIQLMKFNDLLCFLPVKPVFFHLSQQLNIAVSVSVSLHIIVINIGVVGVNVGVALLSGEYCSGIMMGC